MIPQYRSTLTRLDLSSVLGYMVDNTIEGESSGQLLAREVSQLMGYAGAVALRSPIDATLYAIELLNARVVLMPILAPYVLSERLIKLGKKVLFYDLDPEYLTPVFHNNTAIEFEADMVRIDIRFFGGIIKFAQSHAMHAKVPSDNQTTSMQSNKLPKEFLDLPRIELCWSLEKDLFNTKSSSRENLDASGANIYSKTAKSKTGKTKKSDDSSLENPVDEELEDGKDDMAFGKAEFSILILEQNTLTTAGGGAILCMRDKQYISLYKKMYNHLESWILLTDFNAGLALAQFKQIGTFIDRVSKITPQYKKAIERTRHRILPIVLDARAIPQCIPLVISSRVNEVLKYLRKSKIESDFLFKNSVLAVSIETTAISKESIFDLYPFATKCVTNIIGIPLYSALVNEEVNTVIQSISTIP